jgi:UPF0176 protein
VEKHLCRCSPAEGLPALLEYGRKLDRKELTSETIRVSADELKSAHTQADPVYLQTIQQIRDNIREFQSAILNRDVHLVRDFGPGRVELRQRYLPMKRVGICVPGGAAAYPSTLLMTAVPAQTAGVPEIAVVAPPTPFGSYNADLLAACHELGITEVYRCGGAQGVAALAYGVEGIPRVDKIVGPGNLFVALAKRHVYGQVDIDSIAGPSEVIVLADATANPAFVASDLISQAEHSPGSAVLITWHAPLIEQVRTELELQLSQLSRGDLARQSLEEYSALILADSAAQAAAVTDRLATEHLHISTADPEQMLAQVQNAGAIFLGHYTPVALGDYVAGPSHVLPTGGTARFANGLCANDFLKRSSIIAYDQDALAADARTRATAGRQRRLDRASAQCGYSVGGMRDGEINFEILMLTRTQSAIMGLAAENDVVDVPANSGAGDLPIVNIAAYLFAPLDHLPERRHTLRELCQAQHLKGTILLSTEGINLFMAGSRGGIDTLLAHLRADPLLEKLEVKESYSATQPFSRLLVKLKKEIISFGIEGIAPRDYTSRKIAPQELKQWLDAGRPVTLLDTRNDYEVELGTFEQALPIGVDHFRDFPAAVEKLPAELKQQPIVMFCTGGIRCEKAGPFMERAGFEQVYQLEGGILKYFEDCGGAHYHGDCFVFDQRVALDPDLKETATTQCYACQHPLTWEQQQSEKYVVGKSCPFCWTAPDHAPAPTLAEREQRIREISHPLPGSTAYTNERPLNVPARYEGWKLLDFLCDYHAHIPRETWEQVCAQQLIRSRNGTVSAETIVRGGQRLLRLEPNTVEPEVNPQLRIVYWQEHLVVFDKPAPLPVHPCGRFNRNSMTGLLDLAFPELKLRPAHRLDANTSGLIVFTSHRPVSLRIQRQFERGQAEKTYLCRVQGTPLADHFRCEAPISRQSAEAGSRVIDEDNGLPACTEFRVRNRNADGTTLLEAIPLTGRTNQIRVHLWHLGFPIVGDPVYLADQQTGTRQTLTPADPPLCLHAWKLGFIHPETGERISFETDLPDWADTAV